MGCYVGTSDIGFVTDIIREFQSILPIVHVE